MTQLSLKWKYKEQNLDQKIAGAFLIFIIPVACYSLAIWYVFFSGLYTGLFGDDRGGFFVIFMPVFIASAFLYAFGKNILIPDTFKLNDKGMLYQKMGDRRVKKTRMRWEDVDAVVTTTPKGRKVVFFFSKKNKKTIGCGYGYSETEKKVLMEYVQEKQVKYKYQIIEDVGFYDSLMIASDIFEGKPIVVPEPMENTLSNENIKTIQNTKIVTYLMFGIGLGALVIYYVVDIRALIAFSFTMMIMSVAILVALHFAIKK